MKTAEDEAFEEIERRQGGFHAKRQMAADKLHWSDCAVHNGPAHPAGPCDCGVAQEPVAQVVFDYVPSGKRVALNTAYQDLPIGTKLYTTPPKREWVGLTDEEREQHRNDWHSNIHDKEFYAIEQALKDKNT
jgi:hypothetical protein